MTCRTVKCPRCKKIMHTAGHRIGRKPCGKTPQIGTATGFAPVVHFVTSRAEAGKIRPSIISHHLPTEQGEP